MKVLQAKYFPSCPEPATSLALITKASFVLVRACQLRVILKVQ